MDKALILAMLEIILEHGPILAIKLFGQLGVENPTVDQILALKVKPPEEYFNDGDTLNNGSN